MRTRLTRRGENVGFGGTDKCWIVPQGIVSGKLDDMLVLLRALNCGGEKNSVSEVAVEFVVARTCAAIQVRTLMGISRS